MDKGLFESLQCSICLDLPEPDIYQCKNGHTICKDCSTNLRICPECRIPYGREKIRNRALERVLQDIRVECEFKAEGCQVFDKRRIVRLHQESCRFRPIEFCKSIGYPRCNYSTSDRIAIVLHLKRYHNLETITSPVTVTLKHVNSLTDTIIPLGFLASGDEMFLIAISTMFKGETCSILPIHFSSDNAKTLNLSASFNIVTESLNDKMSWTIKPLNYKHLKDAFVVPRFQLTTALLAKMCLPKGNLCNVEIAFYQDKDLKSIALKGSKISLPLSK